MPIQPSECFPVILFSLGFNLFAQAWKRDKDHNSIMTQLAIEDRELLPPEKRDRFGGRGSNSASSAR
jgi:hypothetical protein